MKGGVVRAITRSNRPVLALFWPVLRLFAPACRASLGFLQVVAMSGRPPTVDPADSADPRKLPPSAEISAPVLSQTPLPQAPPPQSPPPLPPGAAPARAMPIVLGPDPAAAPLLAVQDDLDDDDSFAWWTNMPRWLLSTVINL